MKAVRCKTNERGFSLLELMIVVAIVGILATVSIPNFYRFQAKSRAAEGRAQLSAFYTAQRAFQAEFLGFYSDLVAIGYRPSGTLRYVVGFSGAAAHNIPSYVGPLNSANFNTAVPAVCAAAGCVHGAQDSAGALLASGSIAGATVTPISFTARAVGYVGGSSTDIWQMDESRGVSNPQPGGY